MRNCLFILFYFLLLGLGSCSGFDRITDALELKNEIEEKYDSEEVEVKVTNKEDISVSLIDKDLSDLSPQEKQKIAVEIGEMVLEMQPEGFKAGTVHFVENTHMLNVKTSSSVAFEMFPGKG